MNIEVIRQEGQENNPWPIWIAKSRSERALQEESRKRKNMEKSLSNLQLISSRLAKKTEINKPIRLDTSDEAYQKYVDDELSLGSEYGREY